MPSLLIRNIDPALHARLKTRAARNRRSLEEEVRESLRQSVARPARATQENIVDVARRLFGPENGIDLDLPPRSADIERPPPDFSGPEYDL